MPLRQALERWLATPISTKVRTNLREIVDEIVIQRRHRGSMRRARAYCGTRHLRLHLGSGQEYRPGWINVDLDPRADLHLDLRRPLPFADGAAALVYSEHFLEHIDYPTGVMQLLRESLRVLEPGGVFSVGVPDVGEVLQQYAGGELPALLRRWGADPDLAWVGQTDPRVWASPMHFVNWCFRQWGEHRYAYDYETLALVLREAGFTDVQRRPFDPSLDSEGRRDGTLYVNASKPG